jgi:hypothetical protein
MATLSQNWWRGTGLMAGPILVLVAENTPVPLNRIERILAFMIAAVGGVSVLAIVAVLITALARIDTSASAWLTVKVLPAIGLPIAFVLVIVFLVMTAVRRRSIARDGGD